MSETATVASEPVTGTVGGATYTVDPAVEASPTPPVSQTIKSGSDNERILTDERGKVIKLKRPNVVTEFKFIEALGDAASNQVFFQMTMPLLWVISFDGVAVPRPETKTELYALMARLGDEGVAAVLRDAAEQMNAAIAEAKDAKNA